MTSDQASPPVAQQRIKWPDNPRTKTIIKRLAGGMDRQRLAFKVGVSYDWVCDVAKRYAAQVEAHKGVLAARRLAREAARGAVVATPAPTSAGGQ